MANKKKYTDNNFYQELKIARQRLDITVEEISDILELTPQQIYNVEKKDKLDSVIRYLFVLRAKGYDINKIFDYVVVH